jgi:hypothetical protein
MARRIFPRQGLRSRLIVLSAAPSVLCLVVTAMAVTWLVRDLNRDTDQRALQMAAARFEMRMAELRGRLDALALLMPHGVALSTALAGDGTPDQALFRRALARLGRRSR